MDNLLPDSEKREQILTEIRQKELAEFCKWVKDHHAWIKEVWPYGIPATNGTLDYPFNPEGGLSISIWPQLKSICGPEDDEVTDLNRNEIMRAILKNKHFIQYPAFLLDSVVNELKQYCENNGYLFWSVIEESHYEDVVAYLIACADEITKELHEDFQKEEEQARIARRHFEENKTLFNSISDLVNEREPSSIPNNNVKVIKTVKIGFGHESYWLDFGEDEKVTFEREKTFMFHCFVLKVLAGSPGETVLHRELNDAINERTPEPQAASDKLRRIISAINNHFNEKGRPPDRDKWICSDKGHGYYLNKTIKWDADEKTITNRKSNSVWVQFSLDSRTIDNWNKG